MSVSLATLVLAVMRRLGLTANLAFVEQGAPDICEMLVGT
jgi:hypothetical protein